MAQSRSSDARATLGYVRPGGQRRNASPSEAGLLLLLDELFATVGVRHPDEAFRLPDSQARLLTEVNLADAVVKARAHQVGRRIVERLRSEGIAEPAWPVEVGFSNGQPLLAAFWQADEDVYVGWQYQGRQWRVATILTAGGLKGRGLHARRAGFAGLHASYFDFEPLSEMLNRTGQDWLAGRPRRAEGSIDSILTLSTDTGSRRKWQSPL